jgi:CDP-diacylglycerol--glycerol-3-phosphate 3-phosphatidyltransferase
VTESAAPVAPKPRRWITANQVTIIRILALPFPCWALLTRPPDIIMWTAFVFGAVVGATDFVDGWMARRDGPTTLGGLLDPVADKLFIAMLLLPLVAHNECPGWAAGALFTRELLITSLRSSMAIREQKLKTSSLGKLKTVVQMGGLAAFFLTIFVPAAAMPWSLFGCATAFLLLAVWWFARRKTLPLWLGFTPVLLYTIFAVAWLRPSTGPGDNDAGTTVFILMVFFTWVSGFDYLTGSWRAFRATGGVTLPDVARVIWSCAHGLALVPLLNTHRSLAVPVIIALSAELSLGGIENLVSAELKRWGRGSVVPTMAAALVVGIGAWFDLLPSNILELAAWGLAIFSVVNLVVAFVLDRRVILDQPV